MAKFNIEQIREKIRIIAAGKPTDEAVMTALDEIKTDISETSEKITSDIKKYDEEIRNEVFKQETIILQLLDTLGHARPPA